MIKEKQAEKYLEEARISLKAAKSLMRLEDEEMYANIIKNCYDSMEQAISSALAKKNKAIPKKHPAKITEFINSYSVKKEIEEKLIYWLRKRGFSQYVDIKNGKIIVPHEQFDKKDADKAILDCEKIIKYVENLIKTRKKRKWVI